MSNTGGNGGAERGFVKTLRDKYGFLKMDSGEDVFFVPMVLDKMAGVRFEDLQLGDKVEAEVIQGERGLRAVSVRRV